MKTKQVKVNNLKTHQSLSNAVKQESIAISEGSIGSDSIITVFTASLFQFKPKINKKTFNCTVSTVKRTAMNRKREE